jgi:hypothetical protein
MNCQAFENSMMDLIRENALEEAEREELLSHAASCVRCSASLANQQALSAVFRLAIEEDGEVPAHLETKVVSAYRARLVQKRQPMPTASVWRAAPGGYWAIAAALLVVVLAAVAFRSLRTTVPQQTEVARQSQNESAPDANHAAGKAATSTAAEPKHDPLPFVVQPMTAAKKAMAEPPASDTQPQAEEVATDFFALTSGTEIAALESGQIVRVLLPRNAMASYGLPVNPERMDKPVAAQVLISQDGVARAIRFLSDQNSNFVQTGMRTKR